MPRLYDEFAPIREQHVSRLCDQSQRLHSHNVAPLTLRACLRRAELIFFVPYPALIPQRKRLGNVPGYCRASRFAGLGRDRDRAFVN
jgi:hypothetical protein